MTKEEAGYKLSSSPAEHRCGICSYLLCVPPRDSGKHECGIVAGSIDKMYGCNYFDVDLIRAANDCITIASHPPKP